MKLCHKVYHCAMLPLGDPTKTLFYFLTSLKEIEHSQIKSMLIKEKLNNWVNKDKSSISEIWLRLHNCIFAYCFVEQLERNPSSTILGSALASIKIYGWRKTKGIDKTSFHRNDSNLSLLIMLFLFFLNF